MAFVTFDNVKESSTTTGTGALTLSGAYSGFQSFGSKCSVGDTFVYGAKSVDSAGVATGAWEVGLGTYSATNTLTRTTVLDSSNSGAAVSFAAGTKLVYMSIASAQLTPFAGNVKAFGAKGDGTTDDTTAIQAAMNSGAKAVIIPPGTYKVTSTLTLPANVSLIGAGIGETIIDGSSVAAGALTGGIHINVTAGTLTSIASLSTSPIKGTDQLVFGSAPAVAVDDVIVLYNATNSSWSNFRTYYREGEYCRVASVSGSTVKLQAPLASAYVAANMTCYKYTTPSSCTIQGFTLKGTASTASAVYGLQLTRALDCAIKDVRVYNCSYAQISLQSCVNVAIDNCVCEEDFVNTFSGDYGLLISNSQSINVTGGYYASSRHGVTMGGADAAGCVVNRYNTVSGVHVSTASTALQALDCHGNCEYINFINNYVGGSFSFGGNNIRISGNTVRAHAPTNKCLYAAELSGIALTITDNLLENESYNTSNGSFIDIGGNGQAWGSNSYSGGALIIQGNRMNWGMSTFDSNAWHIKVTNSGFAGTDRASLHIRDNTLTMRNTGKHIRGGVGDITVNTNNASIWDLVEITGNRFDASGFIVHTATTGYSAATVICENNLFRNGSQNGMGIQAVRDYICFKNNTVINCNYTYMYGVSSSNQVGMTEASNNTFINTCVDRQNSSAADVCVATWYAKTVVAKHNNGYENTENISVASNTSFVIGETITGATSAATAVVLNKRSTTELAIGTTRTGTFTGGENLNGSTSGTSVSTYTASSTSFNNQNMLSFINVDTVYHGANTHNRLATNYGLATNAHYPLTANRLDTVSANKGNASYTFNASDTDTTLYFNTALTALRTVTLSTTGAWNGLRVKVVRGPSATGAFNISVGGLTNLTVASSFCEVQYNGTAWVVVGNGTF